MRLKDNNPDFLVVGAPKCATTWLWQNLSKNPKIFVPKIKDIYYFDEKYEEGEVWYKSFFNGASADMVAGEFSHNYMYSREALDRIKADIPAVKIIVCLRRPSDRAFSHAKFFVRDGLAGDIFKAVIKYRRFVIEWSMYENYLPYVFKLFSGRLLLIFHEDINDNPVGVLNSVDEFLGIESFNYKLDDLKTPILQSSVPRLRVLAILAKTMAIYLRRLNLHFILSKMRGSKLVRRVLYVKCSKPKFEALELSEYLNGELVQSEEFYKDLCEKYSLK